MHCSILKVLEFRESSIKPMCWATPCGVIDYWRESRNHSGDPWHQLETLEVWSVNVTCRTTQHVTSFIGTWFIVERPVSCYEDSHALSDGCFDSLINYMWITGTVLIFFLRRVTLRTFYLLFLVYSLWICKITRLCYSV